MITHAIYVMPKYGVDDAVSENCNKVSPKHVI